MKPRNYKQPKKKPSKPRPQGYAITAITSEQRRMARKLP